MSMSFMVFSCSECEYSDTSMVLWGIFNYQGSQGLVPVERQLGWCHQCEGLAPIEVLPSEGRIKIIEQREFPAFMGPVDKTVPLSESEKTKNMEWQRAWRERELKDEYSRLSLLVDRESGPRCLSCGSTSIFYLPNDIDVQGSWCDPAPPTAFGVAHPGCGGSLLVCHSEMRFQLEIPDRLFDMEGCQVSDESCPVVEIPHQLDLFEED